MMRTPEDRRLSRRGFLAFAAIPLAVVPFDAFAATPAETNVSSVGNGVLAAARSNSVGKFRAILKANADIPAIAIYSLGPYRKSLAKGQQSEYFGLVENYISKVFASHSKSLAGQKLTVVGAKDAGDSTMVRSQIVFGGGRTVPVTWRLVKRGGGYRVFDVNVDGVWLASTQKTNFTSVLKKNGGKMSALLDYLRN
jgi:phospholipid transport system substrate-binding protein